MKLVILLPDVISIRVITRSVLLAFALLSFPWFPNGFTTVPKPDPKWVDNPFLLPMLIADLKREGLFTPNCRAVFLGDPGSRVSFLRRNRIDPIRLIGYAKRVGIGSVDFVLAADGVKGEGWFGLVDRAVRVGGVVVVRFGSDLKSCIHLPANYRVAYVRRFGSTVVAVKKVAHGNAGGVRGYDEKNREFSIVR